MEILVQCRSDVALKISYLDYNEIRAIIESQSKLKEILSDSPKFTLSYKISGEVDRYILDKKFLYNLFGDNSIVFSESYIPINESIECVECEDTFLIVVDPYRQEVSFEFRVRNDHVVEDSYKSSLESFSKILGRFCETKKI
jgi:hypothetical protein